MCMRGLESLLLRCCLLRLAPLGAIPVPAPQTDTGSASRTCLSRSVLLSPCDLASCECLSPVFVPAWDDRSWQCERRPNKNRLTAWPLLPAARVLSGVLSGVLVCVPRSGWVLCLSFSVDLLSVCCLCLSCLLFCLMPRRAEGALVLALGAARVPRGRAYITFVVPLCTCTSRRTHAARHLLLNLNRCSPQVGVRSSVISKTLRL
jgi:hypothetical protein